MAAVRFVALLPGSKLSGTIFVLRVKTGAPFVHPEYLEDPGVPGAESFVP